MNARRIGVSRVLAVFAAGTAPAESVAADWARIEASGADQHAYDRAMIAIRGDEITYWRRVTFPKPVRTRTGMARSAIYQERIHCRDHTVRALAWQVFADEGVTLESSNTADTDAAAIIPETVGDRFGTVMCQFVEARRRRDADLAREEAQLANRRKDLELLKAEIDQLEASVFRLRLETAKSQPAPAFTAASGTTSAESIIAPSTVPLPAPTAASASGADPR